MLTKFTNIEKAKTFSNKRIESIREALADIDVLESVAVVAVGSIARREASEHSDLDYFLLGEDGPIPAGQIACINNAIERAGLKSPAADGAFAAGVSIGRMVGVIGGDDDSTNLLTKRMLFLLESDWLSGESVYVNAMDCVLRKYISDEITPRQIARFLLNDVIRYYRTICVDFEYKTGSIGKSWGDRNIKLMFSRRLLYFSGLLAVAATAQSTPAVKRDRVTVLLRKTPIDRVHEICGDSAYGSLQAYDQFLGWLADGDVRQMLRSTTAVRLDHSEKFREMKNAGHHFAWHLEALLSRVHPSSHPIHQALSGC